MTLLLSLFREHLGKLGLNAGPEEAFYGNNFRNECQSRNLKCIVSSDCVQLRLSQKCGHDITLVLLFLFLIERPFECASIKTIRRSEQDRYALYVWTRSPQEWTGQWRGWIKGRGEAQMNRFCIGTEKAKDLFQLSPLMTFYISLSL